MKQVQLVLQMNLLYPILAAIAVLVCWFQPIDGLSPQLIWASALMIAALGVPHGGLDHWCGRRLMLRSLGRGWPLVFFPAYVGIAALVAAFWLRFPAPLVLGFFLLSAWHFGREERPGSSWFAAISLGGLVIWASAVFRPLEMTEILSATIPPEQRVAAATIVDVTRLAGAVMLPLGLAIGFRNAKLGTDRMESLSAIAIPAMTVILTAATPILVSFSLYFCLWHSLLGLRRLRSSEGLTRRSFVLAVAPLSVLAVVIVATAGILGLNVSLVSLGQSAALQMTFIGLASIAVPHIILNEFGPWLETRLRSARLTNCSGSLA